MATVCGSVPEVSSTSDGHVTKVTASRRSSLESAFEPELVQCATETSRPSTAGQASRSDVISTDISSTPAIPIEIPQMITEDLFRHDAEVESQQTASSLEMLRQNANAARFGTDPSIVNRHDGLGANLVLDGAHNSKVSRSVKKISY